MTTDPKAEMEARKQRALELMAKGKTNAQVAAEAGVHVSTVRRLREGSQTRKPRRRPAQAAPKAKVAPKRPTVLEMLRAEAPDVYRVLLDAAKQGDIRAATLVVKLLGNSLAEGTDDGNADTAYDELERGLQSLPSDIASEVAGLLAAAHNRGMGQAVRQGADAAGAGLPAGATPSAGEVSVAPDDHPPDEGADSV